MVSSLRETRGHRTISGMTLLSLVILLVVVGVGLYLLNRFVPMQPQVKTILNVVVVLVLILWICQEIGVFGALNKPIRIH